MIILALVLAIYKKPESKTGIRNTEPEVQKSTFDSLSQPQDTGNKPLSREILDLLPNPEKGSIESNSQNTEKSSPSTEILDLLPAPVKK